MVAVQIRDVPDDVHTELVRKAEEAGMSLNQFMLDELRQIARRGRNAEIFARAAQRRGKVPPDGWATAEIRRLRDAAAGDR